MEYKKGDRVKHPTKDDWGLGEVLEDSNSETVKVFFVGIGDKTLSLSYVQPIKVEGDKAKHPVLDNLKIKLQKTGTKYQSLSKSIELFLDKFPDGFYGEKFNKHEREYKDKAHDLALEVLGQQHLHSLLESADYEEIVKRVLKIVNVTNLIWVLGS